MLGSLPHPEISARCYFLSRIWLSGEIHRWCGGKGSKLNHTEHLKHPRRCHWTFHLRCLCRPPTGKLATGSAGKLRLVPRLPWLTRLVWLLLRELPLGADLTNESTPPPDLLVILHREVPERGATASKEQSIADQQCPACRHVCRAEKGDYAAYRGLMHTGLRILRIALPRTPLF